MNKVGNEHFLVATKRLYKWVYPSVGWSVRQSVSNAFPFRAILGATYAIMPRIRPCSSIYKSRGTGYLVLKKDTIALVQIENALRRDKMCLKSIGVSELLPSLNHLKRGGQCIYRGYWRLGNEVSYV